MKALSTIKLYKFFEIYIFFVLVILYLKSFKSLNFNYENSNVTLFEYMISNEKVINYKTV